MGRKFETKLTVETARVKGGKQEDKRVHSTGRFEIGMDVASDMGQW